VQELKNVVINNPTARDWDGVENAEDAILPLARIYIINMGFTSGRTMRFTLPTWNG
jgi:hypothetical protein